ncbi:hypothetical protein ACOME3_009957 [Neoechinorhynchus agilis]
MFLLQTCPRIDARDQHLWTPLMKACYWCQPDAVLVLLEAGADINVCNSVNRTSLHELCRSPVKSIRALSNNEGSVNGLLYTNSYRRLDSRSSGGSVDSVGIEGFSNSSSSQEAGINSSAAHLAEIALALVDAGADINRRSNEQLTPLIYAAYHNHVEVALVLIESNCEINAQDEQGWTALHWACDRNNPLIVQLLLDKGCNRNVRCNNGTSAKMRAKSDRVRLLFPPDDDEADLPGYHTMNFLTPQPNGEKTNHS